MDDRILAKILHWIVGPSNRDHLPNLTLTTTRSGKQYLSVKKAEREIGTSYLQSILSFTSLFQLLLGTMPATIRAGLTKTIFHLST